jgi:hypothetical protein
MLNRRFIHILSFFAGICIASSFWIQVMQLNLETPPFILGILFFGVGLALFAWSLASLEAARERGDG